MSWLFKGKLVERFGHLFPVVKDFLDNTPKLHISEILGRMVDPKWIEELLFLPDITGHLNQLNVNLQGKEHTVSDLHITIVPSRINSSYSRLI